MAIFYTLGNKLVAYVKQHKNINYDFNKKESNNSYYIIAGTLGGSVLGFFLFYGLPNLLSYIAIFAGAGYFIVKSIIIAYKNKILRDKQQECRILFESVELLMRSGYPLQKALFNSQNLVNILKPSVKKSLAYWHTGSTNALEILRREINLPEGDILVSLLAQLNQVGINNFDGVIQRETRRLEELQNATEKQRTSKKPYLLVMFRTLPILIILGGFMGALYFRLEATLPF